MTLVSIDPGKHMFGWAAFEDGHLYRCGLVKGDDFQEMMQTFDIRSVAMSVPTQIVVEVPQVYQQRMWKGDPNDLIDVAIVAGAVAARFRCETIFIRPRKWKGTRPKKVCNKLTLDTLDPNEMGVYQWIDVLASLRHNVLDAIGIGLWRLGRR